MTDKLISDLGAVGAAIADNTATEVQRNGQTTTEQALGSDWKTYIKSWIAKADVGLGNVDNTSDVTKNAAAVTLTNKALTSPVINTPTGIVKADVGLGNVLNSVQLVAASNLSDLASAAIARKNIGIGNVIHPGYKAGNWYVGANCWGTTVSGSAQALNTIYLTPLFIPQKCTLSDLAINLITAAATSNCQLAIYNSNPSDPTRAGTLVGATGSIATTTTGNKTATFSGAATFQLDVGWYFFAMNSDTSALVVSTLGAAALNTNQLLGSATLGNILAGGTNSNHMKLTVAQSFGTWPDLTSATYTEAVGSQEPFPTFKVTSVP